MSLDQVLCCNVISDSSKGRVCIFRHPIYSFDEDITWPPSNWREIACWHCCHTFDSQPIPLPHDYEAASQKFRVFGVFCGFSCAKQYLLEHVTWSAGERTLLLEQMACEAFGYMGPVIVAAPARHRLVMFGGDLSIEEFRQHSAHASVTLTLPLLSLPEIYERSVDEHFEPWSVRGIKAKSPAPQSDSILEAQEPRQGLYVQKPRTVINSDRVIKGTLSEFMKKK